MALMEREANYTAVGAFVILVTTLLGLFVYWYSDGRERRNYEPFEIYFGGSVSGLSQGGPIRYLGVDVGRVRTIRIDKRDPARVQVIADIDSSTPISDTTTAQLSLAGVTGLLFIDLRQNVDRREIMPPVPSERYPVINTVQSSFDSFLSQLPVVAERAGELLERAQVIFSAENSEALGKTIQNLKAASDQMPDTMKKVNALVVELDGTSAEVRKFAAALNETVPSLGPKVWDLTEKLTATATNLERASAEISTLVAENRDGLAGFTRDGLPELERTLREARAAAEQFGALADSLNRDPSQILYRSAAGGVQVPR
jgi:phospholipid/cholesterol/gamma-HCH transport system substrate-binding protein